jgi:hypothetical protein
MWKLCIGDLTELCTECDGFVITSVADPYSLNPYQDQGCRLIPDQGIQVFITKI